MEDVLRELLQGVRALRRRPGPALAIVATLTVAIGGATAIFSFVDGVLLRPLDVPGGDRIVVLCETHPDRPAGWCAASPPNLADWTRESPSLEVATLARSWSFSVESEGRIRLVRAGVATLGLLAVFGARPVLGRGFEPGDLLAGSPRTVVLSEGFWRSHFGADRDLLREGLELDGEPHEVVGVLPAGFAAPDMDEPDVWVPLWPDRTDARWWRGFGAWARLADGATVEEAQAELLLVAERLAAEHPDSNAGWSVRVDSLHDHTVAPVRPALVALLGAVGLVLLVACANVANLLLAQATVRERELALRAAIGARAGRLARQLIGEGLVLALAGAALGGLVAVWVVELFRGLAPAGFPRVEAVAVDARAFAFALLAGLLTCVLFSLAPVLRAARLDVRSALQSGPSGAERPQAGRVRSGLAVAELALALVLLVGGGLLARSLWTLQAWDPGFEREGLAAVQVFPPQLAYTEPRQLVSYYERAVEALAGLPGVVSAGAGSAGPLFGGDGDQEFYPTDRPVPLPGERPLAHWYDATPGYFRTLGIPIVKGRDFGRQDGPGAPRVAIVNATLAALHLGDADPVGRRLHLVTHDMDVEVVGVVGDVRPFRPGERPVPEIYWPIAQVPRAAIHFVVRSATPEGLPRQVSERLAEVDPDVHQGRVFTLDERVERRLVTPRFHTALVVGFALLAGLIAAAGVYGVLAFAVGRRTREIGVRLALGARRRDVLGRVLASGARIAVAGLVIGLALSLAVARLLRGLLAGVEPYDPITLAGASAGLLALALLACLAPALRATRIEPAEVLRHE